MLKTLFNKLKNHQNPNHILLLVELTPLYDFQSSGVDGKKIEQGFTALQARDLPFTFACSCKSVKVYSFCVVYY